MSWTVVVPLKAARRRKSRLATRLTPAGRMQLSEQMAGHVLACLGGCAQVGRILLLSPEPPAWPRVTWWPDQGHGLNRELAELRDRERRADLLVVHADLPLLTIEDIAVLIAAAATSGVAIAPDRHELGTNALALTGERTVHFAFGRDSFVRHLAQTPDAAVVRPAGLTLDVDTPEDLDAAVAAGFPFPGSAARPPTA